MTIRVVKSPLYSQVGDLANYFKSKLDSVQESIYSYIELSRNRGVSWDVETLIQYYLTVANLDSIVFRLFNHPEFPFEAAIDIVGFSTGLSDSCVLSIELYESFTELCREYNLDEVRKANIDVAISIIIWCRLL